MTRKRSSDAPESLPGPPGTEEGERPSLPLSLREELDTSTDLIFVSAPSGRVVWINAAYERLTGTGRMPVVGQPFSRLMATPDARKIAAFFLKQKRGASTLNLRDVQLAGGDRKKPHVAMRVRLVEDRPDERYYVGVAREVQEGTVEPETLRRRHNEVTARVIEARAGARVRTEFLGSMSDEIHALMDNVMSMVQLLLESPLHEDQQKQVQVVRSSTQTLLNMLNDTLEYSRLESRGLEIVTREFDLRIAADDVARQFEPIAIEKGLTLEVHVAHDVPARLRGDPGRLRQVMLNLTGSAIRFSEQGDVVFHITRVSEDDAGVVLRFAVSHPVVGESAAALGDLVEAFLRSGAPGETQLGARLSFAIARRTVLLMGGEVGVEVADDGSRNTMWFQLELEKQAERPAEKAQETAAAAVPAPAREVSLEGMLVMVLDSSPTSRKSLVESLKEWGCVPVEAESSALALIQMRKAAQAGKPVRVALVEKELADGGTYELAKVLRSDKRLERTLPLLLAGTGQRGDAAQAEAAGFRAYLMKPLKAADLREALLTVLGQTAGGKVELVTRHSLAEARQSRVRVLMVEDSQVDLLVSQWALERQGYSVEVAATAAAALEACEHTKFSIVLLDLQLPDGNGYDVVAELRKREFEHEIERTPIVAITADTAPGTREKCIVAGMDDYLAKPVDLESLCSTVIHWIKPSESPAPSAAPAAVAPPATPAPVPPLPARAAAPAAPARPAPAAKAPAPAAAPRPAAAPAPAPAKAPAPQPAVAKAAPAPAPPPRKSRIKVVELGDDDVVAEESGIDGLPTLDLDHLEEMCMGVATLRDQLLNTYLAEIGPRLERLTAAVNQGEAGEAQREAHGLRGMMGTIGARAGAELFAALETVATSGEMSAAPALLERAVREADRARAAIEALPFRQKAA